MKFSRDLCKKALFLTVSLLLYCVILFGNGSIVPICCFASIVLCWLHALSYGKSFDKFIIFGLLFTVFADFFLVLGDGNDKTSGMVFFLLVQLIYAAKLDRLLSFRWWKLLRIGLTLAGGLTTWIILGARTDLLAVISVCYYSNLILNLLVSLLRFSSNRFLAIGFVLFLLCDTVIGLQVATSGYLPVDQSGILNRVLYPGFNLAWFFYLPSQVLISLGGTKT